jgi:diguanylate cyclase (GGDEF)-like protein
MEWLRLQREQGFLSVILFDIDYFKRYNDSYGHQQGDRCLYEIAQAIQGVIKRPADLLARYGGEEFGVILPNTPAKGALVIAERIHQVVDALKIPHKSSEVSNQVTLSLGIGTLIPQEELSTEVLLGQADQALYLAKRQGRNRTAII